jgi:His/Glu/Gln/Arg/opine family amino acid ABC transporter permease subunit
MNVLVERHDVFLAGLWVTLQICVLSATGALILGAIVGIMRVSPIPPLRAVGTAYVTVIRNVPLTVVMFFMAFGLPALGSNASFLEIPMLDTVFGRLGTDLPYFRFAVIALSVYTAAFVCEAIRSGVNAVSAGQAEAARSLGLSFGQSIRYVILPQAVRAAAVPLGTAIIAMTKNSALAGFFGVVGDLSQTADQLTSAEGYAFIPVALGISAGYLMITVPLGLFVDSLERRRGGAATSGGGAEATSASALYDVPGPRSRRRIRTFSLVVGAITAAATYLLVYRPLNAGGQFSATLWGPLVDPSDERMAQVWRRIGQGLNHTLVAAIIAIAASLLLGIGVAILRVQIKALRRRRFPGVTAPVALVARGASWSLGAVTRIFIEYFRGLPVIITIFFVGHTLPAFGVDNALWYVIGGLTLYNMVVLAEILRSGMEGQAAGQREAAAAIGLTAFQTTRMVLLPQAFRTMLPALISQMVVILKDTSLGFITSYEELMNVSKQIITILANPIQLYFVVGAIFIAVNYSLSRLARYTQRRLSRSRTAPQVAAPSGSEPAHADPVALIQQ